MSDKIRILFPYIEAGMGHIMPMRSIVEEFSKKYGDKFEIVESKFYSETNNPDMIEFEKFLSTEVRKYSKSRLYGYWSSFNCQFWGRRISAYSTMRIIRHKSYKASLEHMEELHPDVVFSTHWASNYLAWRIKEKPICINYCPDAFFNKLFECEADMNLISMPYGYNRAMKKRIYNEDNLKLVPFLIRNEVFDIPLDKKTNRKNMNLPLDKFTIVLAEGGYGIGKMKDACEELIKLHIPMTVVPICGKNEELYNHFMSLKSSDEVTFIPYSFTDKILELEASADLFCGKSGNIIAEPTFFGVPSIITNYATIVERYIGQHYIDYVKCAVKEFKSHKIVKLILDFIANPEKLKVLSDNAKNYHSHFGAEETSDIIYNLILKKYPDLKK